MAPHSERSIGFTLLEILGVLSVLAILISLTLPVLQMSRAKAKMAQAKSDISRIESALNLFRLDNGFDPTPANAPGLLAIDGTGDYAILNATAAGPRSPSTQQPYLTGPDARTDTATHQFLDPWKTPYWISAAPTHNLGNFDIASSGPDKTKGNADDINNWSR